MDTLKLIAFDAEDLGVVSAHVQDAILRAEDLAWQPRDARFAMIMMRFDWSQAIANGGRDLARRQTALRFERVRRVRSTGLSSSHHRAARTPSVLGSRKRGGAVAGSLAIATRRWKPSCDIWRP